MFAALIPREPATAPTLALRRRRIAHALLAAGVSLPAILFAIELAWLPVDLNDGAFHLGVTRNAVAALAEGVSPLDFWIPTWLCGFALFHYYNPLPYLLLTAMDLGVGHMVALPALYRAALLLVLCAFPVANYRALRWLQLPRETAAWAAFLSFLVAANAGYGIELESFTWAGYGLFTQSVALPLLPLALAGGWRVVQARQPRTLACAVLLAAALLAHILYGYIAALSLLLTPLFGTPGRDGRREARVRALLRLLRLGAQTAALVLFFVAPLVLSLDYHSKSLFDPMVKFDSHGAAVVLTRLISGALFDYNRLPILTVMLAVGLYLCSRRWLDERVLPQKSTRQQTTDGQRIDSGMKAPLSPWERVRVRVATLFSEHSPQGASETRPEGSHAVYGWLVCCFVLWTALYFGRATWGPLIDLLPISRGLHMERLSSAVHLFGIWIAAVAFGHLTRWCLSFADSRLTIALCAALALLVAPAVAERTRYAVHATDLMQKASRAYASMEPEFRPILERLQSQPPGRVFAGAKANWGGRYRVGDIPMYHVLSAEAVEHVASAPFSWALSTDAQLHFAATDGHSPDLYDVRYLLSPPDVAAPPGAQVLLASARHRLMQLPSSGRFALVSVPLAIRGDGDSLSYVLQLWTKSGWPRQQAHVQLLFGDDEPAQAPLLRMHDAFWYSTSADTRRRAVFGPPEIFPGAVPPPPAGSLADASVSRQQARVTVNLAEPGTVLFKSTYDPGWHAAVDGQPVETMLLTPGMIGVRMPAGQHTLELEYRRGWGKAILLLAGVLLAIAIDRIWKPAP